MNSFLRYSCCDVQSSGDKDSTCFVSVETKVRRYMSCCSDGRDWSFLMSSSGFEEGSLAMGGSLGPLCELGRRVEDIGTSRLDGWTCEVVGVTFGDCVLCVQ